MILTPYQRGGHGSELYKSVYQYVLAQPHIAELSVEDPAEAFEDLRDKNDLQMLLAHEKFMEEGFGEAASYGGGRVGGVGRAGKSGMGGNVNASKKGKMGPPTDKAWAERWRKDLKLAGVSGLHPFSRHVRLTLYCSDSSSGWLRCWFCSRQISQTPKRSVPTVYRLKSASTASTL